MKILSLFFLFLNFPLWAAQQPDKLIVTPVSMPAKRIVIGQNGTPEAARIGRNLIELAKKDNIEVDLIVPGILAGAIMDEFKNYLKDPKVSFVNVPAEDLLWAQDVFQFMSLKNTPYVIDLPYNHREGEHAPAPYALAKKMSYRETFLEPEVLSVSNGDFGGNIEAFDKKNIIIGSNMSAKLKKWLENNIVQKMTTLDVDWLETGHVDEIISLLPVKPEGECPGVFVYASSDLAHKTIEKSNQSAILARKVKEMDEVQEVAVDMIKRCYEFPALFQNSDACKNYLAKLKDYDKKILANLEKVKKLYPTCQEERFIPLPLIFFQHKGAEEEELAFSMNPNPVNGIFLNSFYIVPDQFFKPFNQVIAKALKPWVDIHFTNADYINALQGGLHCMTNVFRAEDL